MVLIEHLEQPVADEWGRNIEQDVNSARRDANPTTCGGTPRSSSIVLEVFHSRYDVSRVAYDCSASEQSFSLRGQLLIASPSLADGTFDHSVIILSQHNASDGAAGAIINHGTETTVGELLPEPEFKALRKLTVYHGGPLATDELTFSSFSWSDTDGLRYRPRISAEAAAKLIGMPGQIVRACIGHSAWSPGQLENELTRNTWIPLKPDHTLLSRAHDLSLWNELLKDISPYHHLLSQAPQNPFLN